MAPADAAARQRHPGSLAARRSPALHGRAWGGGSGCLRECVCVCVRVSVCVSVRESVCVCARR